MPKKFVNVDDGATIPFYNRPEAIQTMADVWKHNQYGNSPTESSFLVHGHRADGTPILLPPEDQHQRHHETFKFGPGDTDIVHTHPNEVDPKPSVPDMDIANQHPGLGMYVVSKDGLYRYVKGMKNPELVQTGSDMSKWNEEMPADHRPDISALPAVSRPLPPQEVPPLGRIGSPEEDAYKLKALPR